MKELSIEEKAKRYDEAIEIARQYWNDRTMPIGTNFKLERMFHELKESEDERIRKALVEMVHDTTGDSLWEDYDVHEEDALNWLEKQAQKPENPLESDRLFREGVEEVIKHPTDYGLQKMRQKPAWSEEDENFLKTALWHISYSISKGKSTDFHCETTDWLKSLKDRVQPQPQWKPSEEQIKSVKEAACYSSVFSEKTINNLISLSEQLKKLREE